jgi:hypothetical protein
MCYYCLLILANGGVINYSYTVPITGTVNASLSSLLQVDVLLGLLGNSANSNFKYTYQGRTVGMESSTSTEGTAVCRYHVGIDRRVG